MPELPEVRAHAERLQQELGGLTLERFEPLSFTALKNYGDPAMAHGHALQAVTNRGKHLVLRFEPLSFVVHLMQGGRLRMEGAGKAAARPRGGLARWRFEGDQRLLFTEAGTEKKAGIWLAAPGEVPEPLAVLGPQVDEMTVEDLAGALAGSSGRLHGVLRDQRVMAGLGRRLANEVCWQAQLSPFATANKLDRQEIERLHAAIAEVVQRDLELERQRADMSSSKERAGAVHHRKGQDCPRCGDQVREVTYRAYQVNYCATCQTDGRILADNTTSKFLR